MAYGVFVEWRDGWHLPDRDGKSCLALPVTRHIRLRLPISVNLTQFLEVIQKNKKNKNVAYGILTNW